MSKKFLIPIDMNGLEIQNFLVHNLAAVPSSAEGKIYFNTQDKKLYYYNGTKWIALVEAAPNVQSDWNVTDTTSDAFIKNKPTIPTLKNVFGKVKVGTSTIEADTTQDTLELAAGSNVTLTPDTTNDKVTISATDTTYSNATTSADGLMSSADKTKLDGITAGAEPNRVYTSVTGKPTGNQTPAFGGTATISQITQSTTGQITATDRTITIPSTTATTSAAGLMSPSDKAKLDGMFGTEVDIVGGQNVNITYDSTNNNVVISAIDTTYTIDSTVTSGSTNPVSSGAVYNHVDAVRSDLEDEISDAIAASDAMRFVGTVGTGGDVTELPTTGVRVGDTYRVITAGTYAGQICEIGDLIIATATTPTWTVAQTNIDGAITSLSNGTGISVTGSGSSRTISLASGVTTAKSVGDTSNQTPGFGRTFKVLSQTVDTYGRTTATADHTVTIPSTAASSSAAGLMTTTMHDKLAGIESGAQVNRTYTAVTGKPTAASTPGFGGSVTISQISQSTTGQITATDRTITIPSTAATTSAKGLVRIGNGLNVSSGTISTKVQNGSVTLAAGSTSTTASVASMIAFSAYDASTGEELVIDATQGSSAVTFSIAAAYTNAITIKYTYAA